MRILILASIPYDGLRRRQQQVASGLAARGHEVLYIEPPRPFRSLIDPARFTPQEIDLGDGEEGGGEQEAEAAARAARQWPLAGSGIDLQAPHSGLAVARKGVAPGKMGEWGWAARVGWKLWAAQLGKMLSGLENEGEGSSDSAEGDRQAAGPTARRPDVMLVYHPALIVAVRDALPVPLVFECLDDFPALAPSAAIAAAYEEALQAGLPLVDGFLAVNRYLDESWARFVVEDAPRRVIEHGVDLQLFHPPEPEERAAARRALELPEDARIGAYLGRFDARISFADLECAFAEVPNLHLLLLGEVSSEGADILERLPQARVHRVGPLRQPQAARLLAAADLLLLPLRREPHLERIRGLKLYEYLATGVPVLASFRRGVKAFREIVYLYADDAELRAGLRSALAEQADAPVRAGRLRVARQNGWDERVQEIEAFLGQVVHLRAAAPAADGSGSHG